MRRRTSTLAVLLEAMMVVVAAIGFALAANELSPRGLMLGRNYFPGGASRSNAPPRIARAPAVAAPAALAAKEPQGLALEPKDIPASARQSNAAPRIAPAPAGPAGATNGSSADAEITRRLKDKGLQSIQRAQTERLFHDPRYEQGQIIFVDARNEEEYGAGHIPGAFQMDPYHPEKQLANVLARCQEADQVVVYCTGGDCEDADIAAILLREAGVAGQKLFVYVGGFTDWTANHLAVEPGAGNRAIAPGANK